MDILQWFKKKNETLMIIPEDYQEWLKNPPIWEHAQASPILRTALESKEKKHCCGH